MPLRTHRLASLIVACLWIATPVSAAVCGLTCAPQGGMAMAAHGHMAGADAAASEPASHEHHHLPAPAADGATSPVQAPAAGPCATLGTDHACCATEARSGVRMPLGLRGHGPDPRPAVAGPSTSAPGVSRGVRVHPADRPAGVRRGSNRRAYVLRI